MAEVGTITVPVKMGVDKSEIEDLERRVTRIHDKIMAALQLIDSSIERAAAAGEAP